MVAAFMDYLDLRDYKFISGERMMEYIHAAQQEIVQQIIDEDPSFFVATSTLSMVANQATYDLPLNARRGTRIIFGENLTSSSANGVNLPVPPARIRDYFMFSDYSLSNQHPFYHFAMENDQIRILSKPTAGELCGQHHLRPLSGCAQLHHQLRRSRPAQRLLQRDDGGDRGWHRRRSGAPDHRLRWLHPDLHCRYSLDD